MALTIVVDLAVLGSQLVLMILEVFSNLNNSPYSKHQNKVP